MKEMKVHHQQELQLLNNERTKLQESQTQLDQLKQDFRDKELLLITSKSDLEYRLKQSEIKLA